MSRRQQVIPEGLLTAEQAAAYLNIHPKTLYERANALNIPFVPIGKRNMRFRRESLDAWVRNAEVRTVKQMRILRDARRNP